MALLVLAVGAEWLLGLWTDHADMIVALALAAVVALAGPQLQAFFLSAPPAPTGQR